jgi:hypothetical protein
MPAEAMLQDHGRAVAPGVGMIVNGVVQLHAVSTDCECHLVSHW